MRKREMERCGEKDENRPKMVKETKIGIDSKRIKEADRRKSLKLKKENS